MKTILMLVLFTTLSTHASEYTNDQAVEDAYHMGPDFSTNQDIAHSTYGLMDECYRQDPTSKQEMPDKACLVETIQDLEDCQYYNPDPAGLEECVYDAYINR